MSLLDSITEQLVERYGAAEVTASLGKLLTSREKYEACIAWDAEAVLLGKPTLIDEIPDGSAVVTVEEPDKKGGYLARDVFVDQVRDGLVMRYRNPRQRPVW